MTSSIIDFLEARLAEGEAAARAAMAEWAEDVTGEFINNEFSEAVWSFLARHDPARVLREVQAKRAILNAHQPVQLHHLMCTECEASRGYPCRTLKNLAAIYSDHPDYRKEWAA